MDEVKRNPDYHLDDLSSEFDYQSEVEKKNRKRKRGDFWEKEYPGEEPKLGRSQAKDVFQEEHGRLHRKMNRLMTMDAYSRHKEMINLYHLCYPGATSLLKRDTSSDKTDYDVLKANHKFVWTEEELQNAGNKWESRMAKKYYDKLFKEYCIVDLTYYKQNKIAMRWRVEKEVKSGKGHFMCGNKMCSNGDDLTSWEVNFCYQEGGERKNTLVKARLCSECSDKLNYGSQKKKYVKKLKQKKKRYSEEEVLEKRAVEKQEDVNEKPQKDTEAKTSTSEEIWSKPIEQEEKTVDEDIDDYLNEIFV